MKNLGFILLLGFVAILLACGFLGLRVFNQPLGPALTVEANPPANQPTALAQAAVVLATTTPSPAPQVKAGCGGSGAVTFLLLGESSPEDIPHRGADAIRLVKVDFDRRTVAILAIPPDLWVQTPVLEKLGKPANTLTVLYWDAKQAAAGSEKLAMLAATEAFAQTLADNWDYVPTHYITVSQPRFAEMIDTLGGIDIHLPEALDATPERFGVFPAGDQLLDGQRTVDFVRVLDPASGGESGQWARFARQNQALKAILAALLEVENWPKIPGLARQFGEVVATDLSVIQMSDLICMVQKAGSAATHAEITPDLIAIDSAGHQVADVDKVKVLLELVSGE